MTRFVFLLAMSALAGCQPERVPAPVFMHGTELCAGHGGLAAVAGFTTANGNYAVNARCADLVTAQGVFPK